MNDTMRALGGLVACAALAGCSHSPAPLAAAAGGPHALYAPPASDVQLETRGRLRPQYRASGIAGEPLPYENAVESSLFLCAALGPLFGPCAGVLIGGAALAGVTETAVAALSQPGSAAEDAATLRQAFAPNLDYASELGRRIVAAAMAELVTTGDAAVLAAAPAPGGCAQGADFATPHALTAVDVVRFEVELEPGYQYRLVIVVRVRASACADGSSAPERRYAYRGRPQLISRDPAAARARFDAEIAQAVTELAADVAGHVGGQPLS